MKNKKIIRLFTAALAVALCATAFAVPFAGGGEGEPYYTETAGRRRTLTEDDGTPEITVTDDEDPGGDDSGRPAVTPWTSSPNCWAAWGP